MIGSRQNRCLNVEEVRSASFAFFAVDYDVANWISIEEI